VKPITSRGTDVEIGACSHATQRRQSSTCAPIAAETSFLQRSLPNHRGALIVDKLYQEISSFPWRNNNDEQLGTGKSKS
jgi:hypothetical protein